MPSKQKLSSPVRLVKAAERHLPLDGFVGRDQQLNEICSALDRASAGRGGLLLVSGEPGIGKTSLAGEAAQYATSRGMRALWGRCWEGGGAPAYWPWIQLIRGLLESSHQSRPSSALASKLGELLPELGTQSLESSGRPVDPERARFELFDSVATLIRQFATVEPLLIVIDDLHDADRSSLMLLRFIAREIATAAVLIIATYRTSEVRRSAKLRALIGDLSRESKSIELGGLDEEEVAKLVRIRINREPSAEVVARVCAATGGNPLYVDGIARIGSFSDLAETQAPFRIPDGLGEVLRRRLLPLSGEANSLLGAAAAIGNEFEASLCARVASVSIEEARRWFKQAAEEEIIKPLGLDRFRFSHGLVRLAIYDQLDENHRVELHRLIGEAIEEADQGDLRSRLSIVAHHFSQAHLNHKAVEYSVKAGDAARAMHGYEEAVEHWKAALERIGEGSSDAELRAGLLERAGTLMHSATDIGGIQSVEFLERAIETYESVGKPEDAARVHMTLAAVRPGNPMHDPARAADHLRQAKRCLANVGEGAPVAALYCSLAEAARQALRIDEAVAASARAVELAEGIEDQKLRARIEQEHGLSLFCAGRLKESFAFLERAGERGQEVDSADLALSASWNIGMHHFLLYDLARAYEVLKPLVSRSRLLSAAESLRRFLNGRLVAVLVERGELKSARNLLSQCDRFENFEAGLILHEGDWEGAAEMFARGLEKSISRGFGLWAAGASVDLARVQRLLGRIDDAEHTTLDSPAVTSASPPINFELEGRARLALMYVESDRLADAARQLSRCDQILASGEDWRGIAQFVVRAKAALAAAAGDVSEAEHLFGEACEKLRRCHATLEQAETLYVWARALVKAREFTKADRKFSAANEIYRRCGVGRRWMERLEAARKSRTPGAAGSAINEAVFRRDGAFWSLSYRQRLIRLKDSKGLNYIAFLLQNPAREFLATDLAQTAAGAKGSASIRSGLAHEAVEAANLGDAGPALDGEAKTQYRGRLAELRAELDEAERMNDLGRIDRAREETAFIMKQLSAAVGAHGADRPVSRHVERARWMVTKRIKADLKRIAEQEPALGRMLQRGIRTGIVCTYVPDPDHPISWTF